MKMKKNLVKTQEGTNKNTCSDMISTHFGERAGAKLAKKRLPILLRFPIRKELQFHYQILIYKYVQVVNIRVGVNRVVGIETLVDFLISDYVDLDLIWAKLPTNVNFWPNIAKISLV